MRPVPVRVFEQLALYVLSFLEPKDLLQAAQTCRYWRILAEDNLLWREKCREEGESLQQMQRDDTLSHSGSSLELPLWPVLCVLYLLEDKLRGKSICFLVRSASFSLLPGIDEPLPLKKRKIVKPGFTHSPWKSAYIRQHRIDTNWRRGDLKSPKVPFPSKIPHRLLSPQLI